MKKILILITLMMFFTGCVWVDVTGDYKIKKVENGYEFQNRLGENSHRVFLTPPLGKEKKRVWIGLTIPDENYNYMELVGKRSEEDFPKYKILKIDAAILEEKEKGNWKNEFLKMEFLNDLIITKKDGKKIIIPKDEIKDAMILPEALSGPIIVEFGDVKLGGILYHVPKIYMQKYKEYVLGTLLTQMGGIERVASTKAWSND